MSVENRQFYTGVSGNTYAAEKQIGRGGFASVHKAKNVSTGETVALKQTKKNCGREVIMHQAASSVDGVHPILDHNTDFMVTPYAVDGSLQEMIPSRGMTPESVVRFGTLSAGILSRLHSETGIIHNDGKPQNWVLVKDPHTGFLVPRLIDFDNAVTVGNDDRGLSDGSFIGTPHYIPPECVLGEQLSPETDVYMWGETISTMISGRKPFAHLDETHAILRQIDEAPILAFELFGNDRTEYQDMVWERVIQAAVAKKQNERPTAEAAGAALNEAFREAREKKARIQRRRHVFLAPDARTSMFTRPIEPDAVVRFNTPTPVVFEYANHAQPN
jgi:eukaryotic-like serine/threonine-protein kinase